MSAGTIAPSLLLATIARGGVLRAEVRGDEVSVLQPQDADHIVWTAETIRAELILELITRPRLVLLTSLSPARTRRRGGARPSERAAAERAERRRPPLPHPDRVRGRYVIRFAIGQLYTTRAHVARAWQVIEEMAREPRAS